MAERSTFTSDRELLAEGLVLTEAEERRAIARFSVMENLADGMALVFDFSIGRVRMVDPATAIAMILSHRGSLETIPLKGRPPGEIGEWRSRRRLRVGRR